MTGDLERRSYGRNLARATNNALDEIIARQLITERVVKAKSQVTEFAASEVMFLKNVQRIAETSNPDAADAIAAIVGLGVAGITRTVGEFGAQL